jgi:molybdopterin synthase catalytic subunit
LSNIKLFEQTFDPAIEISRLTGDNKAMGAIVSFIGTMRDINEGDEVSAMRLEHYPGMTEKSLEKIVDEAQQRWQLGDVSVFHRVGLINPGDPIVLVAVSSPHRGEAFEACEFIIDFLKTRAPFWKKEVLTNGERWVNERDSDQLAAQRWIDNNQSNS